MKKSASTFFQKIEFMMLNSAHLKPMCKAKRVEYFVVGRY